MSVLTLSTEPEMDEIQVAVGVICRDRKVLVCLRHRSAHQGGLWEFPGGKVEAGETVKEALSRELLEELGISVSAVEPLLQVRHDYGDKAVWLNAWWVSEFTGEERGREGQPLQWANAGQLGQLDFPAANKPILKAVLSRLLVGLDYGKMRAVFEGRTDD